MLDTGFRNNYMLFIFSLHVLIVLRSWAGVYVENLLGDLCNVNVIGPPGFIFVRVHFTLAV